MDNLYSYEVDTPYHASVGAVLYNDRGEICLHKYLYENIPNETKYLTGGLSEMFTLMRETVRDEESLVAAVARGILEEFGAVGSVEKYLGAIIAHVATDTDLIFEKVTLYHSVKLESFVDRGKESVENKSGMVWVAPAEALAIMEKQVAGTTREELNEVKIIERFIAAYETKRF
jgi:hypothetical protein